MFEHDYALVGKHATYTKFLAKERIEGNEKERPSIFNRYIDVYMNAATLGFLYGRKGTRDSDSNDRARIYADAFATERLRCDYIYRLIMLLDETPEYTIENKVDRAFRDDAKSNEVEKNIANMELFNSYVLGGIEVLYETFAENCTTKEDYINKIYEVVTDFKDEINGIEYNDKIKEAMTDYNIR
jgi:hypothetical protein